MARLSSMSLFALLLVAAAAPAPTAERVMAPEVKALVDRMQGFYERTQDFTADFAGVPLQDLQPDGDLHRHGGLQAGEDALGYMTPSKRTSFCPETGSTPSIPTPRRSPRPRCHQSLSASGRFLRKGSSGTSRHLADECKECAGTLLTLVPKKPDARFREVQLEIDPKTAQVRRSIVIDPDGSRNSITFSGLKTNVSLPKETFQLTPPPGTQIIDSTATR
jgi:outer membrane lipoprotein carrier protein